MKDISKIRLMIVAGGMLAAVSSCSDFADYNEVSGSADPTAGYTLWENISNNANLTDFASVLRRIGYDKVLDAAHTYTVWAPVNNSFNMDSLNNIPDAKVEKEFVKNLIADYAHKETDENDTVIYMLNEKVLKFVNKNTNRLSFDAKSVLPNVTNSAIYNYPNANGLLYTLANPAEFHFNGYEILSEMSGVADNMLAYFKKYETITLDEKKSVKGEIIDGVQHYDDSVMIVDNVLFGDKPVNGDYMLRANLTDEDSLYTVLIPTDQAWNASYDLISKYYNYIPNISYQNLGDPSLDKKKGSTLKATDGSKTVSIPAAPVDAEIQETGKYWTDSITKRIITKNIVFSETNKRYNSKFSQGVSFAENDTIYSTTRNMLTNPMNLDKATERILPLSNGHARIINKYPFLAEETYAREIKTHSISRIMTSSSSSPAVGGENEDKMKLYFTNESISKDELDPNMCTLDEDDRTLEYVKTRISGAFAPELDFYLPGVLSTTYDIYAVIVPACIENPEMDPNSRLPYALRFDLNYTDENNKQITGRFDGEKLVASNAKVDTFLVAKNKVDTVKLGRVTFPICYSGTEAAPNIKVMHAITNFTTANRKKFEQALRVANIIMKPVYENEENANKED